MSNDVYEVVLVFYKRNRGSVKGLGEEVEFREELDIVNSRSKLGVSFTD